MEGDGSVCRYRSEGVDGGKEISTQIPVKGINGG